MSLFVDYLRSTSLYKQLCEAFASADGNLLEATNDTIAEAQIEFLRWAICLSNPRVILETGTNKGFFAYLMSHICRRAMIYTFDSDPQCGRAITLVNRAQDNIVAVFQAGDSRETLSELNVPADFAWIDGGHTDNIPFSDLMQCYRLRVKYVAVDDTVYPAVNNAVDRVIGQTPYRKLPNPFSSHDRRGAVLLRLEDHPSMH